MTSPVYWLLCGGHTQVTNDSKRDEGDVTDNTNIDNLNVELNKPFEPDEVKKSIKKPW